MLALLPVSQVRFLNVIVLRSHSMLTKLRTDTAHHLVRPLDTFPKQLHVGREAKQTFIATCISINCVKILHIRLPYFCKQLLLFLDLQRLGQLQKDAVNQLVVCQLVLRTDPDPAEDLIMDVSIQSLHQLRSRQAGIHLQERQCHLALWCEERLSASLRSQTLRFLFYQPERYRHLAKRKK